MNFYPDKTEAREYHDYPDKLSESNCLICVIIWIKIYSKLFEQRPTLNRTNGGFTVVPRRQRNLSGLIPLERVNNCVARSWQDSLLEPRGSPDRRKRESLRESTNQMRR